MVVAYLLSLLLVGLIVFYTTECTVIEPVEDDDSSNGDERVVVVREAIYPRLPTAVAPSFYKLKLIPYISVGNFTVDGEVRISLNCSELADNITVNINDLEILEESVVIVNLDSGVGVAVVDHVYDPDTQTYSMLLEEMLQPGGQYELQLRFLARLNDLLQGFYRSSYVDSITGQTRWLASTQFSPTDARRAFPCFDEPAFKARFQISIARPRNLTSLSNMPLERTEPMDSMPGWLWDHYPPTVPMSTYLVAFIVSDLTGQTATLGRSHRKSAITSRDVQFKVWSRRDAIRQTQYAARIGPRILRYLEGYFNIPFPLPKQDMVALPDFGFNAMENWGLITFRESAMLYDVNVSTASSKASVAEVIAHELAHQWFGNLVTPRWWNDLWLKEGFATFIGYQGMAHVEPSWRTDQLFVHSVVHSVFALDALESSHPISVPVEHPDQIRQIFDSISYSKGASIIRMMSHFLGEETFKAGLTDYLQTYQYGNTRQNDLWDSLTTQAHLDGSLPMHVTVQMIMDTWTLQTGYPVVTVIRDYDTGMTSVTQELFRLVITANGTEGDPDVTWWVPLTFTTQDAPDFNTTRPSFWLENTKSISVDGLPGDSDWVIFNIQETGYYRVNYDSQNWHLLTAAFFTLPDIARSQLLDDAFNLARAGCLGYPIALDLLQQQASDTEYLPWAAAFAVGGYLREMVILTSAYGNFKDFMLKLIKQLYNKLEFEERPSDSHLDRLNRVNVLDWACSLIHEQCIWNSRAKFRLWMSQDSRRIASNPISPNQRRVVYCTAIKHGGSDEWDFAWKKYLSANVGSEKEQLLDSLGCARDLWLLNRYLDLILLNDSGIRKQDGVRAFTSVASNEAGHALAFNYLRNNWEDIQDYYGLAFSSVSKMVSALPTYMNSHRQLQELEQFRDENQDQLGTTARSFEQAIEKVKANIRWMDNSYAEVAKWLKQAVS